MGGGRGSLRDCTVPEQERRCTGCQKPGRYEVGRAKKGGADDSAAFTCPGKKGFRSTWRDGGQPLAVYRTEVWKYRYIC